MKKLKIALILVMASVATHLYLSWHYYPLQFGLASEKSVCSINETFNCDAVSVSKFATFLDIPMAVWGLSTNITLLFVMLLFLIGFTQNQEIFKKTIVTLSGMIAFASVVMGGISFMFLQTYCLFCIIAYILSFIGFYLIYSDLKWNPITGISDFLSDILKNSKSPIYTFVSIPVIAFLIDQSFIKMYGADQLDSRVQSDLVTWQRSKDYSFSSTPLIAKGSSPEESKLTIVEFADFRCGHCKMASLPLSSFVKSKNDVRLEFFPFPLDGACNSAIERANGLSCRWAKAVFCVGQLNLGWKLHDYIFANQEKFNRYQTVEQIDWEVKSIIGENTEQQNQAISCMDSQDTHETIAKMAELGSKSDVQGTPTIYVNGKMLPHGPIIPLLNEIYKTQ